MSAVNAVTCRLKCKVSDNWSFWRQGKRKAHCVLGAFSAHFDVPTLPLLWGRGAEPPIAASLTKLSFDGVALVTQKV